jgi:hypothetical protein
MNYKLLESDGVVAGALRLADNTSIPFAPGNRDYQEYLEWLAEGNTPEPADPPPPPSPDWRGFLASLRDTTVFAGLRGAARADVAANALATELRLALGEAALGMADLETIQALLGELLPTLSESQVAEIAAAIEEFHIPLALE